MSSARAAAIFATVACLLFISAGWPIMACTSGVVVGIALLLDGRD